MRKLIKPLTFFLLCLAGLSACNPEQTLTPVPPYTPALTEAHASGTLSPATQTSPLPTLRPTRTPQPAFSLPPEWQALQARMELYGEVAASQLSEAYYKRVQGLIQDYGKAEYISALEYHGDDYSMNEGAYSMNPSAFKEQLAFMMKQNTHFVTVHELEAFVYGKLALPSRSIILTSDLSSAHIASLASISHTFKELESQYGYKPHMIVFIFAGDMQDKPGSACQHDTCWKAIRQAKESGYFTFGSHSWSHMDASKFKIEITKADFEKANQAIHEKLGLNMYALAWPFEASYEYTDRISEMGFTLAFGGLTRKAGPQMVQASDPTPMRLPRLLPPGLNGFSIRPQGKSLEEMLQEQQKLNPGPEAMPEPSTPGTAGTLTATQPAKRILVLEYHGIDYNMYDGTYAMNPQTFRQELETLCQKGYTFLSMTETEAFVQGKQEVPEKSVLLTNDVTIKSVGQIPEIGRLMHEAAETWNCQPHMALFVVTGDMQERVDSFCKGNLCWAILKEAHADSAFFTLGVHSSSNLPFGQASPAWHAQDMAQAQNDMNAKLDFRPFALSWPYEICPLDMQPYQKLGFTLGFGGVSKALTENYPQPADRAPLCLPRMLPPNLEGKSLRPQGMNFEEMLDAALKTP
ncbi:MAG: polysaccharide deacetylase family protein [Anaerolineaceae bacterium]|nr:polysaccharide deacetylase family protein [Anaerolineaceae bacterium]